MQFPIKTTIKAKFLAVILLVTSLSFGIFFYFSINTFSEDKKLFVMDLNMNLLRASISEIKLELKGRLEEMQVLVPRIYHPITAASDPYQGLPDRLRDEVFRIQFFKKKDDKNFEIIKTYVNQGLIDQKKMPPELVTFIDQKHLLTFEDLSKPDTSF